MLINASHPSTGSCISPNLLDTYVRYKQDTRAIINWLISHGTRKQGCLKSISIKDMLEMAETVQKKSVMMPEPIDYHFREAIAARTQLTKFFRREGTSGVGDQDNLNHEYFTTSLTKIYTGLCECCTKPMKTCDRTNLGRPREDSQTASVNRFAALKVSASKGGFLSADKQADRHCDECVSENWATTKSTNTAPRLIGDHLGDAFELRNQIEEIANLRLTTVGIWEQAAKGDFPLAVAALVTNAAFAAFEEVEQRLKILCNGSSPEALQGKLMQMEDDSCLSQSIEMSAHLPISQQIEALKKPWDLLLQFKRNHQNQHDDQKRFAVQRPSQVILRQGSNSASVDSECLTVMLQDIEQHVQPSCRPTCIVRLGTPIYADIGYFFTHDEDDTNGLRCSFGLGLLLDTYKSYLLTSQRECAPPSCRLQALKFAQEALPYIRAVLDDSSMPCRCCHTLAFHLENLHFDFRRFLQEKVFNLYFQSPWVCGSHILEMLELLFYYGLRLFSYRHYVGSVVHVYNILRECTGFQPIPLLEQLCDTFSDLLFPGGRPTRSFKACCFRYMGGRLRFNSHTSDHKSGSHQMWIPARTAKATAGYGLQKEANDARFEYRKVSLLHHIKERGYHLDNTLWNGVYNLANAKDDDDDQPCSSRKDTKPRHQQRPCSHKHAHAHDHERDPPQFRLSNLTAALLPELTSSPKNPFPPARINFLAIYLSCVHIVTLISDKSHPADKDKGSNCLCFLDGMLGAADRYREVGGGGMRPFGSRELVGICGESIRAVLWDRPLEEFLWKGV